MIKLAPQAGTVLALLCATHNKKNCKKRLTHPNYIKYNWRGFITVLLQINNLPNKKAGYNPAFLFIHNQGLRDKYQVNHKVILNIAPLV